MDNNFIEKIKHEFIKNYSIPIQKHSYELLNEYRDICEETDTDPEQLRQIQCENAKLYYVLYIAVQEYHNCLSLYLRESGIKLPDLDSLFSYAQDHQD